MRYILDAEYRLDFLSKIMALILFASVLGWGEVSHSDDLEIFDKKIDENILLPFCVERKLCGYMRPSGEVIVPAELQSALDFQNDRLALIQQGSKWGVIDNKGQVVIRAEYDSLGNFNLGLAPFKKNNKWGYIDKTQSIIIPAQFDMADTFTDNGRARVRLKGKYGFINRNGIFVIYPEFDAAENFDRHGFAKVKIASPNTDFNTRKRLNKFRTGLIDDLGATVIPLKFDQINDYTPAGFIVKYQGKSGLYDKYGKGVLPPIYDRVLINVHDTNFHLQKSGKHGLVDFNGEIVLPFEYDFIIYFEKSELVVVHRDGQSGFANRRGKIVIPIKFESAWPLDDYGFARVKVDGKWGYIDKTGKMVIPAKYDEVSTFGGAGLAAVKTSGKWGYINQTGDMVIQPKYQLATVNPKAITGFVQEKNKSGYLFINLSTRKPIFPRVTSLSVGHAYGSKGIQGIYKNKKEGFINTKGEIILPPIFDKAKIYQNDSLYNGYGYVEFGNQKYPFKEDGTTIGFALEDVKAFD